jgi:hypothetical protein
VSGAKESREIARDLRKAGLEVTQNGHRHVLDEQSRLIGVLPKTPGSQRSVLKSRRMAEKLIRGEPVRAESDHNGRNAPGKLTREPQEQTPAARPERPLKQRFEPESTDVGPLGYTPAELTARMPAPAPARPRRQFVSPDSPAYPAWFGTKRHPCAVCDKNIIPGNITPLHCRMSAQGFLQLCTRRLRVPAGKAAALAAEFVLPGQGYGLLLCAACLQRSGLLGRVPREAFMTLADYSDPEVAGTKRLLTAGEQAPAAPPAFRRAVQPKPKPPEVVRITVTPPANQAPGRAATVTPDDGLAAGRAARQRGESPGPGPATIRAWPGLAPGS